VKKVKSQRNTRAMIKGSYPTDMSNEEWDLIEEIVTAAEISDQEGARQVFQHLSQKRQRFQRLVRSLTINFS